jgi:PKD repeat protein
MPTRCRLLAQIGTCAFALSFFPAHFALADHCTVAKIAIVSGTWEESATKTSLIAQSQDSAGVSCHVSETLRLSFESSGSGTFTGQTGSVVQAWISTNSANRNFYYQHSAGASDTITVKAGYGTADSWNVSWQATYVVGSTPAAQDTTSETPGTTSTANNAGTVQGSAVGTAASVKGTQSGTLALPRMFLDDPLALSISYPKRVSVGQSARFAALPSGLLPAELRTLRYVWNFGDGATSTERTPTHAYAYPGTYVVLGVAERKGHEVSVRAEVTVEPLDLALIRNSDGTLMLQNNASHESDISGLTIAGGEQSFVVPEHTYLLSGASLPLFSGETNVGASASAAFVYDRNGRTLAAYSVQEEMQEDMPKEVLAEVRGRQTLAAAPRAKPSAPPAAEAPSEESNTLELSVAEHADSPARDDGVSNQIAAASAHDAASSTASLPPWAASASFIGVLALGIGALYARKIV